MKLSSLVQYEDNHLLVLLKPPNIAIQRDASGDMDFLSMIKIWRAKKEKKSGEAYLGLVHRLDRPVSGVMVFTKTSKAAGRLSQQIRERKLKKIYLVHVVGNVSPREKVLTHFLYKERAKNQVHVSENRKKGFKQAVLSYKVISQTDETSYLLVQLKTGRAHQIRTQLAFMGYPVVGDYKYGFKDEVPWQLEKNGIALFSSRLEFEHPTTKKWLCFSIKPDWAVNR